MSSTSRGSAPDDRFDGAGTDGQAFSGATLHALQAWCHEAEASGIRVLQEFSARLKGYSLQPA